MKLIASLILLILLFELAQAASRCAASDNCCTVGSTCPTCSAPKATTQRIRRDIRSLSTTEFDTFATAVNIMKTTTQSSGQSKYGTNFKTYDYFVAKHLAASFDNRGDQGHFCSGFMTFHSLLVLEFENALLSVDSSVGALPYWNWNDTYTDSFTSVFSSSKFGSLPGTGPSSQVTNGKFANWAVEKMSSTIWKSTYYPYLTNPQYLTFVGTTPSGYLRSSSLTNTYLTRYGSPTDISTGKVSCDTYNIFPYINWYTCVESGTSPSYHSGPHGVVGGASGSGLGDFTDPITSPNDPIFMLHHANMDRNKISWMSKNSDSAAYFYGFSTIGNIVKPGMHASNNNATTVQAPTVYGGIALGDYVSSNWGFTDADLGIVAHSSAPKTLWTHADAVCYLQPTTAPYTYDISG